MPDLRKLFAMTVTFFCILCTSLPADAQQTSENLALIDPAAPQSAPIVLNDNPVFSLRLIHSVRFELTEERCYYQFFVDALGSSPLAEVRFLIELSKQGQIVGKTSASVQDLDGVKLSKRIREFAFDGLCSLDGVRVVEAMGDYAPAGANYVLPVNLFEREAVEALDFQPLKIALGPTASLPGAALVEATPSSVTGDLERSCIERTSNLRTGPGTEFNIVTIMQPGLSVFTEKRTGDGKWHKVRTQFGRLGWIYYTLLGRCPS